MLDKADKDLEMLYTVLALSDEEICQALAKLEGISTYAEDGKVMVHGGGEFNPLVDGNLLVDLMDKYEVERRYEPYDFIGWSYHVLDGENPIHITERQGTPGPDEQNIGMKKAACLAIILNKADAYKLG